MDRLLDEEAWESSPTGHSTHQNTTETLAGSTDASPEPGPYTHTSRCYGWWVGLLTQHWGTMDPSLHSVWSAVSSQGREHLPVSGGLSAITT